MSALKAFHKNAEDELRKVGIDCKLTIIKEAEIKPRLTICICLFRIPDPYKDESKYTNGLTLLIDNFRQMSPSSVLRAYYDDSVFEKDDSWIPLLNRLKSIDLVELIHYSFPQFKKGNHHDGVLGTIVRFLPLFDFSEIRETIMISDIDHKNKGEIAFLYKKAKMCLESLKKCKLEFSFAAYGNRKYLLESRLLLTDITEKYDFFIRMLVESTVCIKKIDKSIFLGFMSCILNKCPNYESWVSETIQGIDCNNIPDNFSKNYRVKQCRDAEEAKKRDIGMFLFGVDEFFLNTCLLEYFLKNRIPFLIRFQMPNMAHYHYSLYLKLEKREIPIDIMFDMYHFILGRRLHTEKDVRRAFEEVDKKIYKFSKDDDSSTILHNEQSKKIFNQIYDFLQPCADELLALPNLEKYEKQMFEYLKNTKKEHFVMGSHYYKVTYGPNNYYELVLCH